MHPDKVDRSRLVTLTDLPNIGPATAKDFILLGFTTPQQLVGADALQLYRDLCDKTGVAQDPCVLDVFLSFWPVSQLKSGGLIPKSAKSC